MPQFIQLVGDLAPWLVLFYAARAFLKEYFGTLGTRAGHATFDGLAALLGKDQVKPLADVATALADARKASSESVEIVIGLPIPDPYFGTAMTISANSEPEEIAYALAVFVARADELSATMKAEVEAGRAPWGRAMVTLEKDGGLTVRWHSEDGTAHQRRIP